MPYARGFAAGLGLEVTLLHVCTAHEGDFVPIHRDYIERKAEMVSRQWEVAEWTDPRPESKRVRVRAELAIGHPADEILRYADDNNSDLIVMAAHGRSGIRRWAIGSVAGKVLGASKVPVFLVRGYLPDEAAHDEWPGRTILVPLDGSALAESVLPHAATLVNQVGAGLVSVVLLGVCEPLMAPSFHPAVGPEDRDADLARRKQANASYLAAVEERLKGTGLRVCSQTLVGKPADEIVEYASASPLNIIAMASHGRSGPSKWMWGSVAHKVLLGASRPLFLVRPH